MSYAFADEDADLTASLRRIADEELGSAITRLRDGEDATAIHSVRKNLKKTRALLRLLRTGLDDQPAENAALRAIAQALATRRDAGARLTTFDRLFPDLPGALLPLREHLANASLSPASRLPREVDSALKAVRKRAAKWSLHGKDAKILHQGLADTRRKAVRAAKAALADPTSEIRIHDWRKRVKDHWYQARLFAPCWPELFKPMVDTADRLGEALGEHHDLSLFADLVISLPDQLVTASAQQVLAAAIPEARARIENDVFPIAGRLFAGEPDNVADLWLDLRGVWLGLA